MKKKQAITGLALLVVIAASAAMASAQENATPAPTPTPATVLVVETPGPSPSATPTLSVSETSKHPQMSLTKEEWEAGGYTNPYTTDEESGYEPNAGINPGPGEGASLEEVNAWYMARVENCKTLTKDAEYIDCMWRPWVYGF
jgi:hypothetical protein